MSEYHQNKSNNGRVIIRKRGSEEPALANKNWKLWVICRDHLTCEEITVLVTKRINELKYAKNSSIVRELRTDIKILESAYKIKKRINKERIK